MPAGLRPVKNVLFPLEPLALLAQEEPRLRLIIVGPALDAEYSEAVTAAVGKNPFATYIGAIGHGEMAQQYRLADVVLNTSFFEGGMANSLLEAMAWGKPVLVSDIEGNRSLVEDGVTGFVYGNASDFLRKAAQLVSDAGLRERLGTSARLLMIKNHSPEQEAFMYQNLYREVVVTGT